MTRIDHASLNQLRAQQRPVRVTEDLLAAVICIVKSPSADLSWTKGAKRLMANVDRFIELLLGRSDMEEDSETILESVSPFLNRVTPSVDDLGHQPGGLAAGQLLGWVQGIVRLHSILQSQVRPLNVRLENTSTSLTECEKKLKRQEENMQVKGAYRPTHVLISLCVWGGGVSVWVRESLSVYVSVCREGQLGKLLHLLLWF